LDYATKEMMTGVDNFARGVLIRRRMRIGLRLCYGLRLLRSNWRRQEAGHERDCGYEPQSDLIV
jgi:hypothetical protein